MKRYIIVTLFIVAISAGLWAQQAQPQDATGPTMTADGIVVDTEEIVIEVRSMAPVSGIYKSKQDTFMASGRYRFLMDDQTIKDKSELLLNKWLKESK